MQTTTTSRWAKALSVLATIGLTTGGALAALPAHAAPTEVEASAATLTWGVKESFRNYINNMPIFEGKTTLLGATTTTSSGAYSWPSGSGTAVSDASKATLAFGKNDGVHFQSHPLGEKREYALDLTMKNPRVEITSPTTAILRMDITGREFKSATEIGEPYEMRNVALADVTLPKPTITGDKVTFTNAPAKLSEDGVKAFGTFYKAGTELDPLTISYTATAPKPAPEPEPEPAKPVHEVSIISADRAKGLSVNVSGKGFTKLPPASSGKPAAGIYVALRDTAVTDDEINVNPNTSTAAVTFLPAATGLKDGAFTTELTAPVNRLKADADYEIVAWSAHGLLKDSSRLFTEPVKLTDAQREALFGTEAPAPEPTQPPKPEPTDPPKPAPSDPPKPAPSDPPAPEPSKPAQPGEDETAPPASSDVVCTTVTKPGTPGKSSLSWGVKSSFVSYIEGGIAKGAIHTSNGAARSGSGFTWGPGTGSLNDSGLGTISFPGTVRFTGHGGILDLTISNLKVKVTGAKSGALIGHIKSQDMSGNPIPGGTVEFATLSFDKLSASGGSASVALTAAGAKAFAGFYSAGQAMDPLTFTVGGSGKPITEEVCYDAHGKRVNPDGTPYVGPKGAPTLPVTGIDADAAMLPALGFLTLGALAVVAAARRRVNG